MAKPSQVSKQKAAEISKVKRNVFYLISILIPILFFVLLEAGLRLFNYGSTYEQWVESNSGQWIEKEGKLLMLNPAIASKYFHVNKSIPFSNGEVFDKLKKPNAFRIFILGESSAAGYPFEPNGSFSRYLNDRLSLVYPDSKVEVINCSMSAINSYTLRDLTPGILEQKPDLILIYAGHNEYYGALGAGSIESLGNFRSLVNLVIDLEKYRSFQLIRNTIGALKGIFSGEDNSQSGTLMTRMVQDQYIGYGSDIYKKGLSQFDGNMDDILEMITEADVPVIIGTLTCNLRDQFPFVSVSSSGYPPAENVFKDASRAYLQKNFTKADSLFRLAKDLDALRFRAPGDINKIINRLAGKYGIHVLNIDSAFNAESPDHIAGNNMMVDHLHPTLRGYQFMGKLFFNKMKEFNYLPNSTSKSLSDRIQDSITVTNIGFTGLDSVIADYKITVLKNNWPFIGDIKKFSYSAFIHPKNRIDSLAADWIEQKISWKNAHLLAVEWYLKKGDVIRFIKEMDALIAQYPYNTEYHKFAVLTLLPMKKYEQVYNYLIKSYNIEATAFNAKWIGAIHLNKGRMDSARFFLDRSLTFDSNDPQVWYNLAVTYLNTDNNRTLALLDKALAIDPGYLSALNLRNKLLNSTKR